MSEELDLSGLTAKRDELLGKLKALKEQNLALEQERDEWKAKADEAESKLRAELIDRPVDAMLADLFLVPFKHVKPEIAEHFDFARDEAGKMKVLRKDGEPAMIGDREAEFTQSDLFKLLCEMGTLDEVLRATLASGGGPVPKSTALPSGPASKPEPRQSVAGKFGLR